MNNGAPPIPQTLYAEVILPIAAPRVYTYQVPAQFQDQITPGMRVEVNFGKTRLYTAVVRRLFTEIPEHLRPKPILDLIDDFPLIHPLQLDFWDWIAQYYLCQLGEVMLAAMPNALRPGSETKITLHPHADEVWETLNDRAYIVAQALQHRHELTLTDVQEILALKSVGKVIKELMLSKVIQLREEIKETFTPKKVLTVQWAAEYQLAASNRKEAFEATAKAPKQTELLLAFVTLERQQNVITRAELLKKANVSAAALEGLVAKKILQVTEREQSRLKFSEEDTGQWPPLSPAQQVALEEIRHCFSAKSTVLLRGITGSGKTRIYLELIQEQLDAGKQVLYLLPEIALTTQMVGRLHAFFGSTMVVYHSRFNQSERVELWQSVSRNEAKLVVAARSGLFLPFAQLGLVIVDEEHDASFKQFQPNPRYHARDAAIWLGTKAGAQVLLGTATPSLETWWNAEQGRYGKVTLTERFGQVALPEIQIVNLKAEAKNKRLHQHFSATLLEVMEQTMAAGEQILLFQNRRGYSPQLWCKTCDWHGKCIHCDVTLTYHKAAHQLRCHYCNYHLPMPSLCPACGSNALHLKGFGTEKIEDEIKIYFPDARISRLDFDTTRGKDAYAQILEAFDQKEIDILVGTQMVTKGLDFENVGLVGILSADHLLSMPDYRATERAYQMMTQVAGRAGRHKKQGTVILQAFDTQHPVIREVRENDFEGFARRELAERKQFLYPPYVRMIKITCGHSTEVKAEEAAKWLALQLQTVYGPYLLGPAEPPIKFLRGMYLRDLLLKLPRKNGVLQEAKSKMQQLFHNMAQDKAFSSIRITVDVDPI